MKKLYHLNFKNAVIFLILIFAFAVSPQAQTPQYYNANSGGISNSLPFSAPSGYKTQWLIGPGEYNQPMPAPAGDITKLYIYMSTPNGPATYTNMTIKLGRTTLTTLPTGGVYTGQLDTVYFRASVTLSSALNSWMSITLDRSFSYDPAQSLVIEASHCGYSGTGMNIWQSAGTTGITRRNNIPGTTLCVFTYSSQDTRILQCGLDIAPGNCLYTWTIQTSGTTQAIRTVKAVNDMVVWAGGAAGNVRKTTNGGATWIDGNPNPGVISGLIYNIDAIDANTAWCTTTPAGTFIYRTTNGGTNWTQVFTQSAPGFINAIQFIDANTGFAQGDPVSLRWSLWKSTDAGATWDSAGIYLPQAAAEAGWVNSLSVLGNNIWFGTSNTRVYKSSNFGTNWTFGATTGLLNSYSVHFNNATLGLAGGTTIVKTTDGGVTYAGVGTVPGAGNINAIEGKDNDFWYIRGTGIYRSTNGGTNWTQVHTITGTGNDMDFPQVSGCLVGWAVTSNGSISKMTGVPVGIVNNNNQIPNEYKLEQNYPNPFNPSTQISFVIPKAGYVELKVFDILGREVTTLVNEFKQAGSYRVDFNAAELSSGQYFYSIKSSDFTDSKKMMLIK